MLYASRFKNIHNLIQLTKTNGDLSMEIVRKFITNITNIGHYEKYCSMFAKDKIDLRLPQHFTKLHFDMISMFIGNRSCINPFHSEGIS
jgi:hypothetical protein